MPLCCPDNSETLSGCCRNQCPDAAEICTSVSKYWNMSEEDYVREAEKERYHMDNYSQYILEHFKICPQMRDTNIYLKLVEAFPDLQVKRATFYRYMKALREQHGYPHAS